VLLVKANRRLMLLATAVVLVASSSILRAVLLTTALCSRDIDGMSGGRAEEKDHSSSSTVPGVGAAGPGITGVAGKDETLRDANGSAESPLGGGAKADCWCAAGWGVPPGDGEVADAKAENVGFSTGLGAEIGFFALLFCVMVESSAGPGISSNIS